MSKCEALDASARQDDMMVNLTKLPKGGKVSLTKQGSNAGAPKAGTNLQVGLSWESQTDVDSFIVCLDKDGFLKDTVFFNKKQSDDRSIKHLGDDTTGSNHQGLGGDNETILVDLTKVSPNIDSILFAANVYDGPKRGQDFSNIGMVTIRVINADAKEVITSYQLDGKTKVNAAVVGRMSRRGADWTFEATGQEFFLPHGKLGDLTAEYQKPVDVRFREILVR